MITSNAISLLYFPTLVSTSVKISGASPYWTCLRKYCQPSWDISFSQASSFSSCHGQNHLNFLIMVFSIGPSKNNRSGKVMSEGWVSSRSWLWSPTISLVPIKPLSLFEWGGNIFGALLLLPWGLGPLFPMSKKRLPGLPEHAPNLRDGDHIFQYFVLLSLNFFGQRINSVSALIASSLTFPCVERLNELQDDMVNRRPGQSRPGSSLYPESFLDV